MTRPPNIIVVGSINYDYVIESRRRPSPGETVTGARVSTASGGKGANQAVAAALLGASVQLVGRIGDDDAGRNLLDTLQGFNVDVSGVVVDVSAATGAAFVTVTPDGENSIIVASGANWRIKPGDLVAIRGRFAMARVLVVQLEIPDEVVATAIGLVGSETLVVLNAAPYRLLERSLLRRVDVLIVNALEARQLLGGSADIDHPEAFVHLGQRATVVTFGKAGAHAFLGGQHIIGPDAPEVEVVDTTGAGDAFVGALTAWLAAEGIRHSDDLSGPLARALPAAVIAASHSVERLGAQSSYGSRAELGAPWV